jgi:hypothetical protein
MLLGRVDLGTSVLLGKIEVAEGAIRANGRKRKDGTPAVVVKLSI